MYTRSETNKNPISKFFSLALQRGLAGGYITFGGLPPLNFVKDFIFTPFRGLNIAGKHIPTAYYPVQPDGFVLNGVAEATKFRAIVDSGTYVNRLPQDIADRINAA